ncbi:MAG: hypothetical protein Q7V01_14085 [Vicinamibacterales bacterium]|nr:hypothetical protein [Vicinamibacterales bacterium]
MNDVTKTKEDALDSTMDTLSAMYLLLITAIRKSKEEDQVKELTTERDNVKREMDRIEIAELNAVTLPPNVEKAMKDLDGLTAELAKERNRIKNAKEKLDKTANYIDKATKVLELAAKVIALA